jgi:hypothetical protein
MRTRINAIAGASVILAVLGVTGPAIGSAAAANGHMAAAPVTSRARATADAKASPALARAASPRVTAPTFTISEDDIANPERGFYRAIQSGNLDTFTQADASAAYENDFRLLYARINLENYRDSDTLPADYLERLKTGFGYARAAGIKLIVRAVYNFPAGETDYHHAVDAPMARVKRQMAQIGSLLRANSDVVAFIQAGYAGAWGEWHTSSNGLLDTAASRAELEQALLADMPPSRFIQFRYPRYIQEWAPNLPTLDDGIANNFRIGFHNDCFLSSIEDVGTYSTDPSIRSREQDYADRLGDLGPFGAETCNSSWDASAVRRSSCADILREGARYNLTYLNIGYWRPGFEDMWQAEGCMPMVRRSLGYRFQLRAASHPATVARGAAFGMAVTITNAGWARLYNRRPLDIILQNVGTNAATRIVATGTDPRTWVPGKTDATIAATVPADLAAGNYRVLLALPDGSASIAGDPRYAIRFADADNVAAGQQWDPRLGAFSLGTTVRVD